MQYAAVYTCAGILCGWSVGWCQQAVVFVSGFAVSMTSWSQLYLSPYSLAWNLKSDSISYAQDMLPLTWKQQDLKCFLEAFADSNTLQSSARKIQVGSCLLRKLDDTSNHDQSQHQTSKCNMNHVQPDSIKINGHPSLLKGPPKTCPPGL